MFSNITELQLDDGIFKTIIRSKRHYDFVRNVEEVESCFRTRGYNEIVQDACKFVTITASCKCISSIFNYLKLYLCVFNWDLSGFRAVLTLVFGGVVLSLYFVSLYVNVKYFLLPNTISLAKYWNMDNYSFGNVVLGILYNFPFHVTMIFTCFEYNRSDSLMHAATFGKMFTCFVLGLCLLSYNKAFKLKPSIFLREMFVMFIAAIYLYASVYKEMMNNNLPPTHRKESIIHINAFINILVYGVYVAYILINNKRHSQTPKSNVVVEKDAISTATIESDSYPNPESVFNPMNHDIKPMQQFLACVNPWQVLSHRKVYLRVIMSPFFVCYALFTPVVDSKRKMNGWCKWVTCSSCLTFPFYFLILEYGPHAVTYFTVVGLLALLLLSLLTHPQREPTNYKLISLWGLILGFAFMNIIDLEICCILWQFLNYFANISNDILVIMAFPLSYIFVEGIFVVALVKSGHREMAFGFVMGTILFIAFSALPVMLFSICFSDTDHIYSLTDDTSTAFVFTLLTQGITIVGLFITDFELRPSNSLFFVIVTLIYCLFMMLSDRKIIHPMGTIHSLTVYVDSDHSQWT